MKKIIFLIVALGHFSFVCSSLDRWNDLKRAGQAGAAVGAAAAIGGGLGMVWLRHSLKKALLERDKQQFKKLMRMRRWAVNALRIGVPLMLISSVVWKVGHAHTVKEAEDSSLLTCFPVREDSPESSNLQHIIVQKIRANDDAYVKAWRTLFFSKKSCSWDRLKPIVTELIKQDEVATKMRNWLYEDLVSGSTIVSPGLVKKYAESLGVLLEIEPRVVPGFDWNDECSDMSSDVHKDFLRIWKKNAEVVEEGSGERKYLASERRFHLHSVPKIRQEIMVCFCGKWLRFKHHAVNNTQDTFCVVHSLCEAMTGQRFLGEGLLRWMLLYKTDENIDVGSLRGVESIEYEDAMSLFTTMIGCQIYLWDLGEVRLDDVPLIDRKIDINMRLSRGHFTVPEDDALHLVSLRLVPEYLHCEWLERIDKNGQPIRDVVRACARPLDSRIISLRTVLELANSAQWKTVSNDIWMCLSLYIMAWGTRLGLSFGNQSLKKCLQQLRSHGNGNDAVAEIEERIRKVQGILVEFVHFKTNAQGASLTKKEIDSLLVKRPDGTYKWLDILEHNNLRELTKTTVSRRNDQYRPPRTSLIGRYA